MMLGEVVPGGVGTGLYGMLVFAILAVFIAGLMVGRTPEYLGKRIGAPEMKLVMLDILAMPVVVLGFSRASPSCSTRPAVSSSIPGRTASEILYAYTSAGNNNGSAFGGLTANTDCFNTTLGLAMLVGRFLLIVLVLALAGALARKKPVPAVRRHVPDRTPTLRRPARRRDPRRRRPDLLPGARARADRGAPAAVTEDRQPPCSSPRSSERAALDAPSGSSTRATSPRNPVMFVVEVGSVVMTAPLRQGLRRRRPPRRTSSRSDRGLALVHGALRELRRGDGRGPRQGPGRDAAQDARRDARAQAARTTARSSRCRASQLVAGDLVVVEAGRPDPRRRRGRRGHRVGRRVGDHRRVGARDPRAGGDRSASPAARACSPTGSSCASRANPGETFLDRMIAPRRGRRAPARRRTRSRSTSCSPGSRSSSCRRRHAPAVRALLGRRASRSIVLVALLVCLIPTTIGALLSAIGIAGMDRLVQRNVLAISGRAVEAAGDCDVLLLDKTGTITLGNRQATELPPRAGRDRRRSSPTPRSSRPSPTRRPRGARSWCSRRSGSASASASSHGADARPVHGADPDERRRHRTAARSARAPPTRSRALGRASTAAPFPPELERRRRRRSRTPAARRSSSPRTAARARRRPPQGRRQGGHRASASTSCARMGIRTVMITGDNPLTARRSPPRRASTTSSPRRRPRTRWR